MSINADYKGGSNSKYYIAYLIFEKPPRNLDVQLYFSFISA